VGLSGATGPGLADEPVASGSTEARRLQGEFKRAQSAEEREAIAAEVAALRQIIRDVAARAELTKELIQEKSDPALARLEQLLVVSAADAFAAPPDLTAHRAELLRLADWSDATVPFSRQ